ncbi:hypothetical protein CIK05_09205 [Bdellovibrio sp. qaytius]|nr:hypothetical protein CIK05_09205 [Bdellovibrio sp. qaytius]
MNNHNLLLHTGLKQKAVPTRETSALDTIHWGAEVYNLNKSSLYNSLSVDRQNQILKSLNQNTLVELLRIERIGTDLSRCMSENATDDNEHLIYAMISGEEVNHYMSLASFANPEAIKSDANRLVDLIGQIMYSKNRTAITFTLQVVLEGFSLNHLRRLKQFCRSEDLQAALNMIIQDEARHHGTGLITFKDQQDSHTPWDLTDVKTITPLKGFLNMFQVGPVRIVKTVEKYSEGLTDAQRIQLFQELDSEIMVQDYLDDFKKIMISAKASSLVDRLETDGYFKTYSFQNMHHISKELQA